MAKSKRLTASAVINLMTPAQREQMLMFVHGAYGSYLDHGTTEDLHGARENDLGEAWGLIQREWKGAGT